MTSASRWVTGSQTLLLQGGLLGLFLRQRVERAESIALLWRESVQRIAFSVRSVGRGLLVCGWWCYLFRIVSLGGVVDERG